MDTWTVSPNSIVEKTSWLKLSIPLHKVMVKRKYSYLDSYLKIPQAVDAIIWAFPLVSTLISSKHYNSSSAHLSGLSTHMTRPCPYAGTSRIPCCSPSQGRPHPGSPCTCHMLVRTHW